MLSPDPFKTPEALRPVYVAWREFAQTSADCPCMDGFALENFIDRERSRAGYVEER